MYRTVFILLTLATLITGCSRTQIVNEAMQQDECNCVHSAQPVVTPTPCPLQPLEVFEEINRVRALHGLPAISYNADLEPGAFVRAEEASLDFCHYRPDGSPCTTVSDLADGEIIFTGLYIEYVDATRIVDAWMDSPPHRAAVLRDDRDMEMGAGYYLDWEQDRAYWSVLFHLV